MRYRATVLPLVLLTIDLPPSYPSHSPPALKLEGFHHRYEEQLREKLMSKWFPEQMVLYEWFDFCKNDFYSEIISPKPTMIEEVLVDVIEGVSQEDYTKYRDEEYSTVEHRLNIKEHTCDICYTEYKGSHNFLLLHGCLHYFCNECVNTYMTDLITRGEINRVACPSFAGCKTPMSEKHLKDIGLSD